MGLWEDVLPVPSSPFVNVFCHLVAIAFHMVLGSSFSGPTHDARPCLVAESWFLMVPRRSPEKFAVVGGAVRARLCSQPVSPPPTEDGQSVSPPPAQDG